MNLNGARHHPSKYKVITMKFGGIDEAKLMKVIVHIARLLHADNVVN